MILNDKIKGIGKAGRSRRPPAAPAPRPAVVQSSRFADWICKPMQRTDQAHENMMVETNAFLAIGSLCSAGHVGGREEEEKKNAHRGDALLRLRAGLPGRCELRSQCSELPPRRLRTRLRLLRRLFLLFRLALRRISVKWWQHQQLAAHAYKAVSTASCGSDPLCAVKDVSAFLLQTLANECGSLGVLTQLGGRTGRADGSPSGPGL